MELTSFAFLLSTLGVTTNQCQRKQMALFGYFSNSSQLFEEALQLGYFSFPTCIFRSNILNMLCEIISCKFSAKHFESQFTEQSTSWQICEYRITNRWASTVVLHCCTRKETNCQHNALIVKFGSC